MDWTGVDWTPFQWWILPKYFILGESPYGLHWSPVESSGVHMDYGGDSKVLSGSIDPLLSDCFLASNGEGRNLSSFGGVGGEGR